MKARKTTRNKGQVAIELSVACLLLIPLSILGFSVVVCELASSINDRACRDAARAAAEANNYAAALKRAQAAVAACKSTGPLYGPVALDTSKFIFEDYGGVPPANAEPYISVTTTMPCAIPAPIKLLGTRIGSPSIANFTRTYRFPIVKLNLYFPN